MSTGKRLAKRSIIGTRVCAPGADGIYYSGVILAIKTPPGIFPENNNSINLTPNTRYTVRFDAKKTGQGRTTAEFLEADLVGPGFNSVIRTQLVAGQKAFVTHNNREVSGEVQLHHLETDVVVINLILPGNKNPFQVEKRLDEVRLLESRKSARLADQDTDFARLADMAGDRKRTASHTIDVPTPATHIFGSRKRRPSSGHDDASPKDPQLDECSAALVLMSLSASPHSPHLSNMSWAGTSPGSSSSGSSCRLSPSPPPRETSSPTAPLSSSSASDEGIVMDYRDELPRKKKSVRRTIYECTWPKCGISTSDCETIEAHVRNEHLNTTSITYREEEFYYREIEPTSAPSPSSYSEMSSRQPPTLSHMDMARPPHEDPEYQRQFVGTIRRELYSGPINIPQSPHKLPKLSPRPHSPKTPVSPRRARGENKKCRKKYGMEHKEQWCTQCKWKKACSRFGD